MGKWEVEKRDWLVANNEVLNGCQSNTPEATDISTSPAQTVEAAQPLSINNSSFLNAHRPFTRANKDN